MKGIKKASGLGVAVAVTSMGLASAQPVTTAKPDTPPDWLQKPSFDDMLYAWPRQALAAGLSGSATLKCLVNKQGLLQDCAAQDEEPSGNGFGSAALALTPTMLFKPATRNGEPVDDEVTIPISFKSPGKLSIRRSFLVSAPSWSKTPNAAEVMAQLERRVGDKFADGRVVFMCSLLKGSGKLKRCHVVNASQGMAQFKAVGNALTDDFQASPDTLSQLANWPDDADPLVFVPFSFPNMASGTWSSRYLDHVQWTHLADASSQFPDAALRAGLNAGLVTVDCLVKDTGALTNCTVVKESTSNVGLGDMAKKIAETAAVNPWTEEGLPAGGAHVRLPIQMAYRPPAGSPTPATRP